MVSSYGNEPGPPARGGGAAEARAAPISRVATAARIGGRLMWRRQWRPRGCVGGSGGGGGGGGGNSCGGRIFVIFVLDRIYLIRDNLYLVIFRQSLFWQVQEEDRHNHREMLSLAAALLAAPTQRTSHTLAASNLVAAGVPDGPPRLGTTTDLGYNDKTLAAEDLSLSGLPKSCKHLDGASMCLNASSVCAPRSSQFWLLGSHHKTGTELVSCSQPLWALAPCDS